jgi:hypothetical protein
VAAGPRGGRSARCADFSRGAKRGSALARARGLIRSRGAQRLEDTIFEVGWEHEKGTISDRDKEASRVCLPSIFLRAFR